MKKILILGAGKSATELIRYALNHSEALDWHVTIGDIDRSLAESKVAGHERGTAIHFDVNDQDHLEKYIGEADIVVSLMPAFLHYQVAKECIKQKKHLVTASYISEQTLQLAEEIRGAGILMMGEMGLDPGIDHMSAMQIINEVKAKGAKIKAYRSYAGGLVAPESDDNPWNYKFTWNPRNVVLAGQGTAQYMFNDAYKYTPYNRIFKNTEPLHVDGLGDYEVYPNRDSLYYRRVYDMQDVPTFKRGTIRKAGFCEAWDAFVQLGWTDNSYPIIDSENLSYADLLHSFLPESRDPGGPLKQRLAAFLDIPEDHEVIRKLDWLGLFSQKQIGLKQATPAEILQDLLEDKWALKDGDKDMVIMRHIIDYELGDELRRRTSTMIIKGEDLLYTAMAKLVGLPLGIMVKLMCTGKISLRGICIPTVAEVYEPVLAELEELGVSFEEEDVQLHV